MRAEIGDTVTIDEGNRNLRNLPNGKARGIVKNKHYVVADKEYIYSVKFFVDGSVWSVGEDEIIETNGKEKVVFT